MKLSLKSHRFFSMIRCLVLCRNCPGFLAIQVIQWTHVSCSSAEYPSKTQLKIKSREISFAHNLFICCRIVLKCCTEYDSYTTGFYARFQYDSTVEMGVMGDLVKFLFNILFAWISYIAIATRYLIYYLYPYNGNKISIQTSGNLLFLV